MLKQYGSNVLRFNEKEWEKYLYRESKFCYQWFRIFIVLESTILIAFTITNIISPLVFQYFLLNVYDLNFKSVFK